MMFLFFWFDGGDGKDQGRVLNKTRIGQRKSYVVKVLSVVGDPATSGEGKSGRNELTEEQNGSARTRREPWLQVSPGKASEEKGNWPTYRRVGRASLRPRYGCQTTKERLEGLLSAATLGLPCIFFG